MHSHVQISYAGVETLSGFDPRKAEDRKFCHDTLDEYLNVMAKTIQKLEDEGKKEGRENAEHPSEDDGFHIWPFLDSH